VISNQNLIGQQPHTVGYNSKQIKLICNLVQLFQILQWPAIAAASELALVAGLTRTFVLNQERRAVVAKRLT